MFRLIAEIAEINLDNVKLPKIPGLGMLMRMPDAQKVSMFVTAINSQKAQILPKIEEELGKKWGYIRISDIAAEAPSDGSCLARLRIDIADADYDRAIDAILPGILQPSDIPVIFGDSYHGSFSTPDVISYMHQATDPARKEFYLVKALSTEKQNLINTFEYGASTQGAHLKIGTLRFLLRQS